MFIYLAKRAASLLLVFLGLAFLIFVIARIVPGDPARIALGPLATATQVAEMRQEMGLDDSFLVQLWNYLVGLSHLDLGKSLSTSRPVMDDLREALPATLELVLFTVLIQIIFSIPLGVMAAIYRDTWFDNILRVVSLIGVVTPGFVLAIILQLTASYQFQFFTITGRLDPAINFTADYTGLLLVDGLISGRFDVFFGRIASLAPACGCLVCSRYWPNNADNPLIHDRSREPRLCRICAGLWDTRTHRSV